MYTSDDILAIIDHALNTKNRRHIVGGILMSVSVLFGGLAITAMTVKMEDDDE